MHIKKTAIMSFLSCAMAFALAWPLGSMIQDPAPAYADVLFTPTPPPVKPDAPLGAQDAPLITDVQKSVQPQITQTSPNSTDDILNGDFENGRDGSWVEYSQNGWVRIRYFVDLPVTPHSGNWAVWLGGDYDEVSNISQEVAIPSDATTLRYWYWIGSEDLCEYDFGHVKINDTDLVTLDLCEQNNTGGWVQRTVNISAYSGTTVTLKFQVETDSSFNSNLFLDDVTLQGGSSGEHYLSLPLIDNAYWSGYFDDFSNPSSGWASGENSNTIYGYLNGEYQIYHKQDELKLCADAGSGPPQRLPHRGGRSQGILRGLLVWSDFWGQLYAGFLGDLPGHCLAHFWGILSEQADTGWRLDTNSRLDLRSGNQYGKCNQPHPCGSHRYGDYNLHQ